MKIIQSIRFMTITVALLAPVMLTDANMKLEARTPLCNDGASSAENDLWNTLLAQPGGCSLAMILWHRDAYKIDASWAGWGYEEAERCDINRPYAKALNAAYLLRYGLSDDEVNQWHSSRDYRDAGEALATFTHNQIEYLPSVERDWLAYAQTLSGRTLLSCLLFDLGEPTNNPVMRASDFVHEGWHHWQKKYNQTVGHGVGPQSCCTMSGEACDQYYSHRVRDYRFGDMWMKGQTPDNRTLYHTPNQVQVEYLSDLALYPAAFVPTSIRFLAQAEANERLTTRFVDCVGYTVAIPVPF